MILAWWRPVLQLMDWRLRRDCLMERETAFVAAAVAVAVSYRLMPLAQAPNLAVGKVMAD